MKKYIIIAIVSLIVGGTSVYAGQKMNVVWELMQTSTDENLRSKFVGNDHIKVFKFTDNNVNCYVSVSPTSDTVYTPTGYSKSVDSFRTSISCVR